MYLDMGWRNEIIEVLTVSLANRVQKLYKTERNKKLYIHTKGSSILNGNCFTQIIKHQLCQVQQRTRESNKKKT